MIILLSCISLDDASHRNVSFLSLGVFTTLVTAGRVSDECWDFILCSAVTVMQVRYVIAISVGTSNFTAMY